MAAFGSTVSSAAGAPARIAVVVQTGCGFLSGVGHTLRSHYGSAHQ